MYSFGLILRELLGEATAGDGIADAEQKVAFKKLVDALLDDDPKKRPTAAEVLGDPLFKAIGWKNEGAAVCYRVPSFWQSSGIFVEDRLELAEADPQTFAALQVCSL